MRTRSAVLLEEALIQIAARLGKATQSEKTRHLLLARALAKGKRVPKTHFQKVVMLVAKERTKAAIVCVVPEKSKGEWLDWKPGGD